MATPPVVAALVLAVATVAALGPAVLNGNQKLDLSKHHLVETAAAYVKSYQRQFAFLIADETAVQESFGVKDRERVPLAMRRTTGEIFITFLERWHHWATVRDIGAVDGVPVANRVDVAALLEREDPSTVARRVLALNARYNIGGIARNFNDPMIALLPLGDANRSRFSFDVVRTEDRQTSAPLVTLAFRERDRPTLIRPEVGGAAYSRGDIVMEARTGIIRRTRFAVRDSGIDAELATEFQRDERLGLWVPVTLTERYTSKADGFDDLVVSTSTYSNYRRFESQGRVLGSPRAVEP